jgi:hypothetical protein
MNDNLVPNGLSMASKGSLLQVDIAEIIVHEADERNAALDLLEAELPTAGRGRDSCTARRV